MICIQGILFVKIKIKKKDKQQCSNNVCVVTVGKKCYEKVKVEIANNGG